MLASAALYYFESDVNWCSFFFLKLIQNKFKFVFILVEDIFSVLKKPSSPPPLPDSTTKSDPEDAELPQKPSSLPSVSLTKSDPEAAKQDKNAGLVAWAIPEYNFLIRILLQSVSFGNDHHVTIRFEKYSPDLFFSYADSPNSELNQDDEEKKKHKKKEER